MSLNDNIQLCPIACRLRTGISLLQVRFLMKRVSRQDPAPSLALGFHPQETVLPNLNLWVSPYTNASERRMEALKGLALESEAKIKKPKTDVRVATTGKEEEAMQVVTRPYILLGQCFALIPVQGVTSEDPNHLTFSWHAKRVMYTLAVLVLSTGVTVLELTSSVMQYGLNYHSVDELINVVLTVVQISIFLGQARSWPRVMREWAQVEHRMRHFPAMVDLGRKVNGFIIAFCLGTVVMILTRIMGPMSLMKSCSDNFLDLLKLTFIAKYLTLMSLIGYSLAKTLVIVLVFIHQSLLTVYDELTITVLANCLYVRFRQLNEQLGRIKDQRLPVTYWEEMRELYNSLSGLTKTLDQHLSWMTLVCFGANLYQICSLLLRIVSPDNNRWTNAFYLYSLLFTLSRTFLAALMASSVHEESRRPLALLYSVPSSGYNGEICRFQMQATHDEIAITGCNFFSLNRSFMLTVAGTIATYEIVLLQFNSLSDNNVGGRNMTDMCSRVLRLAMQ